MIAILSFSCKPKPIDNLKEVARQAEENKVKRVSRPQLAREAQRVSDSVLVLVLTEQFRLLPIDSALACNFRQTNTYRSFREKYNGRAALVSAKEGIEKLEAEMAELRKYRNELNEPGGNFPATFQTLNDSLLYVKRAKPEEMYCEQAAGESYWVFRYPKPNFVEIMTVKVKPKPAKGPNW
ncbi:MAG TPA: hypothetical protein VK927_03505 [Adhaeribacter sp.]|nr:hypothetical protein [Adhaeribacter sp.]